MKVTLKESLTLELQKNRLLAKKGYSNTNDRPAAFWLGYDQACFELQKRFELFNESIKK